MSSHVPCLRSFTSVFFQFSSLRSPTKSPPPLPEVLRPLNHVNWKQCLSFEWESTGTQMVKGVSGWGVMGSSV